jgi:hypothetical protein
VFIQHPPSLPGPNVRVDDNPIKFDRREITGPGLQQGWYMYTLPIERMSDAQPEVGDPHEDSREGDQDGKNIIGEDDGWKVTLEWHAHV